MQVRPDSTSPFGFDDRYGGYVWVEDNAVYLSRVQASEDLLFKLIDAIEAAGFDVRVPRPDKALRHLLADRGFRLDYETLLGEQIQVWRR